MRFSGKTRDKGLRCIPRIPRGGSPLWGSGISFSKSTCHFFWQGSLHINSNSGSKGLGYEDLKIKNYSDIGCWISKYTICQIFYIGIGI